MNPYYNFYTPIPGPKTLGEYETLNAILERGAWACWFVKWFEISEIYSKLPTRSMRCMKLWAELENKISASAFWCHGSIFRQICVPAKSSWIYSKCYFEVAPPTLINRFGEIRLLKIQMNPVDDQGIISSPDWGLKKRLVVWTGFG